MLKAFLTALALIGPLSLHAFTKVYVTTAASEIAVLNADTNSFIKNFNPQIGGTVASNLQGIGFSSTDSLAYVADEGLLGIWIIDTGTDSAIGFVSLPEANTPVQVCVVPDGSKVYVSDGLAGAVWVLTTTDNNVSSIVFGASKPSGLATNPDGSKLYVADSDSVADAIYVYDTADDAFITTISGFRSNFLAVNSLGIGYEPASTSTTINSFNTNTDSVSGIISTAGSDLDGVAFTNDGGKAYVASNGTNTLQVIVNGLLTGTVALTNPPWQVAVNPVNNAQVYCTTNPFSTVLSVYGDVQFPNVDFDTYIVNGAYLAYITSSLEPPSSLTGRVLNNRFLSHSDIVHRLTWTASLSPEVTSYAINRNGKRIASVSSENPLSYDDHNRTRNVSDFYEVIAVNDQNEESTPVSVFVPQPN